MHDLTFPKKLGHDFFFRVGVILLAGLGLASPAAVGEMPGPTGHAHNDYHHERPLLDALEHGFSSVEADVFLVDGDLLLGHDRSELRPGRTLMSHYIKPLVALIEKRGGQVRPDRKTFHLLIDFKTAGEAAYEVLQKQLEPYRSMLTEFTDTGTKQRAITIILTGNSTVPGKTVASQETRWVGCDGRVSDLDKQPNPHLVPWISDRWASHFKWRGKGEIPEDERTKLESLVRTAHANGQTIRFWAAPDNPASWEVQYRAGVDWINTDKLAAFEAFAASQKR